MLGCAALPGNDRNKLPPQVWSLQLPYLAQKEGNKRRVQADAAAEKKNAVGEWLELLASQDDAAWKENLIGMGSAPNVPKLFHNNGKVHAGQCHHR